MQKNLKKIVIYICTVTILAIIIQISASAASTRKCYLIENKNATAYSNSGLSRKIGTIWGSDEIQVITVTSRYSYVSYPAGTKRKYAYIPTYKILTGTGGWTYTAQANITTYKRPGGSSYGSIYKGDRVTILGTYGRYTQIKYPVSFGYKYAFITNENAERYIKENSGSNSANIANGTYKITTALNNNYALDVHNFAVFNGGNVEIYPFHNSKNEIWKIVSVGNGYYRITDMNSGKSLDVNGASSASGTNVQIWESNDTNAQKWRFVSAGNGYYYIINANGCYLDVQNGTVQNGNNVWVYSGNKTNAQKWRLTAISTSSSSPSTSSTLSYGLYKSNSARITCGFNGYTTTKGKHEGIDVSWYNGADVYSLIDGEVINVVAGKNGRSGLSTIAIYDSSAGKTVIYLHSNPAVSRGTHVKKGQKIATQGWRGVSSSSGSHTHVEVRNGRKTCAAKSVNDYYLENPNPTSYWNSKGYVIK